MFKTKLKLFFASIAIISAILLTSCTMNLPISATSNPVGKKVGVASGFSVFYGFSMFGDATIFNAAKNGGITKISTVDFKITNYLGFFQTYDCIVTGE